MHGTWKEDGGSIFKLNVGRQGSAQVRGWAATRAQYSSNSTHESHASWSFLMHCTGCGSAAVRHPPCAVRPCAVRREPRSEEHARHAHADSTDAHADEDAPTQQAALGWWKNALTGGSIVYAAAGRGAAALRWSRGGSICRTAVMLSSVRSSMPLASRRAAAAARPQIHRQVHSVAAELDRRADTAGDAPALIVPHQGVHWSYQELRDKAHSLATGLQVTG
eukprot:COSAG02_NODE_21060_length_804_cov_1.412766_1_plen_221_part_00